MRSDNIADRDIIKIPETWKMGIVGMLLSGNHEATFVFLMISVAIDNAWRTYMPSE